MTVDMVYLLVQCKLIFVVYPYLSLLGRVLVRTDQQHRRHNSSYPEPRDSYTHNLWKKNEGEHVKSVTHREISSIVACRYAVSLQCPPRCPRIASIPHSPAEVKRSLVVATATPHLA